MIRRGLQILCVGVITLGAAPCLGQMYVPPVPYGITLQDFTNSTFNGFYVQVGEVQVTQASTTLTYQRFSSGNTPPRWIAFLRNTDAGLWNVSIYTNYPVADHTLGRVTRSIDYSTSTNSPLPLSVSSFWNVPGSISATPTSGAAVFTWNQQDAELTAAFPDWGKASTKIPLGFGFAMAFWAAALALHVPMKWVRALADAAS